MQFLIMHGSYTRIDNPKYWFSWLKKELESVGGEVIAPQFPTEDWSEVDQLHPSASSDLKSKQSLSSWEKLFVEEVLHQVENKPFIFIGHSIAPIFMLHMLQKYDFKLSGAVFVSPFFNIPDEPKVWQFYPANKTFYGYDFDFAKIKSQLGKSFVVYGDDDPYVPLTESPLFAAKLGGEIHLVKGGGHCGSIFKEFPLVKDLALSIT